MKNFPAILFQAATPAEFVSKFGGTHVIEKVLVANNGIAAVKCIRSMRQWAYDMFGNDKAVKFVAMVTPEDLKVRKFFDNNDYLINLDRVKDKTPLEIII